jgi:hypothetical protein
VGTLGPLAADGPVELTAPIAPAAQGFYRLMGRAQ